MKNKDNGTLRAICLQDISSRAPKGMQKTSVKADLKNLLAEADKLQNLLYAERKHSVLVVLQGMDASGKDGLIERVFGSMNPQGVKVQSFKVPTEEELAHDFLWRIHLHAPMKGTIQVFNRSHYEDVLVTRVHKLIGDEEAERRMRSINEFEQHLEANNTHVLKFYLHVSEKEQLERIAERKTMPEKMWKYNGNDIKEISKRETYIKYYEEVFEKCNVVPWHIVPADQNWYKAYSVALTLVNTLTSLKMKYPVISKEQLAG